ncbi:MAG: hypothetical protein VZS44_06830 [Bacilli bacterium]|nr:hypothetical protein [Bacilli bacterium]
MEYKNEFFIAGKTRNKDYILKICDIFDKYNISYYCFIKNDGTMNSYGEESQTEDEKMKIFEDLDLKSDIVLKIFNEDLDEEKAAKNFLLVLPAGKSGHIEAGIAYGMDKKCYAIGEYDATDSLYNIFDIIFENEEQLEEFLKEYGKEE